MSFFMVVVLIWIWWLIVLTRFGFGCRGFSCWWILLLVWINRSGRISINRMELEWGLGVIEGVRCCRVRDRWEAG